MGGAILGKNLTLVGLFVILGSLLACGLNPAVVPTTETPLNQEPTSAPHPDTVASPKEYLTPNPVESSMPVYGGILEYAGELPRSFDAHQKVGYGPTDTLPTFNQLVIFDLTYKETVPENIIGDLAESWEWNYDGTEITFKLYQGVKWHDGVPFTADDVVYSLDKMADVNRSAISNWFPAYQRSERVDDYTVKVHLKYASAGFMISLAQGESQIQPKHLAGTDDQSADFMVGTGPFYLDDYIVRVHLKWRRNPEYFKKDQYGNQLPYLDGLTLYQANNTTVNDMLVGRRLDIKNPTTGAATTDTYEYLKNGAPDLLWQKRERDQGSAMFLNLKHKPLDDVRVRRAMALVLVEEDLIIGYSGDVKFGSLDSGLLTPGLGLSKDEVKKLMGWDKPYEERVAEAQRLMAEAGYPDGFKISMMALGTTQTQAGATIVFSDALRKYLKIESELYPVLSLAAPEMQKRLEEDNYDLWATNLRVGQDPVYLKDYFGTGGVSNWSHYSNPDLDKMLAELDQIVDTAKRRETVLAMERILLTDLPALPTGCFIGNWMPYYPYVKNIRWNNLSYSNVNRLEDVWIDKEVYQNIRGNLPPVESEIPTPTPTPTPAPTPTPSPTPATTSGTTPATGDL
ncbi:ABC transporter substrate-binding protein, partial [candidate division WS5 bacterium]